MVDEPKEQKSMTINGVDPADHTALAAYASVHNVSMGEAFGRAVASLTAALDGAEKVIFDRIVAAPAARRRRGRPPVKTAPAGEGGTA